MVGYIFVREFWFVLPRQLDLHALSPQTLENSFLDWSERTSNATSELVRQVINSLISFGAWIIWNYHTHIFSMGRLSSPSFAGALILSGEERRLWTSAGVEDYPSCLPPT